VRIGVLAPASTPALRARLRYSPAHAARTHRAGERRCPYDNSNTTLMIFSGAAPSARSAWLSLGGNPSTQRGCPLAWVYHQSAASLLASCAALARSSSEQRVLDAGTPPIARPASRKETRANSLTMLFIFCAIPISPLSCRKRARALRALEEAGYDVHERDDQLVIVPPSPCGVESACRAVGAALDVELEVLHVEET